MSIIMSDNVQEQITDEVNGVEVRIMNRKQMKELRKEGLDVRFVDEEASRKELLALSMDMIDYVLENVYEDKLDELDEWDNPDCDLLAASTYFLSIGMKAEVKN